jgi:iron complex outermembrane receptor protein
MGMRAGAFCNRASILALGAAVCAAGGVAHAQTVEQLRSMSITDLANIEVSSVSKSAEPLSDAPAAIYVITHEEIVRSGATVLPEILRLAPNLQVHQTSAAAYTLTARGLAGDPVAQNFSNKLLVLIDGRSVYTPLFSGVYWDMQDVLPQDIERIEVISGPGSTLWGANAVNGVINIITRHSSDTQGGYAEATAGNLGRSGSVRLGGRIDERTTLRVYARSLFDHETQTPAGFGADDDWSRTQAGFRLDWAASATAGLTLQGDVYGADIGRGTAQDEHLDGRNILARWTQTSASGGQLQAQAYYDRMGRVGDNNGGGFFVDTYDLDVQHSIPLNASNQLVWGGGARFSHYDIDGASVAFAPPSRTLNLFDVFAQDTLSLTSRASQVLGLKLEDDPYSGLTAMPSVRLAYRASDTSLVWAAASRAIRSPTPFDRDVVESQGGAVLLYGNPNFEPEKLTAYEIGARVQPTPRLSFSVSGYFNVYDDLRTVEIDRATFFPITWGNLMHGHTWGLDAWGSYQAAPWWRLSASYSLLEKDLAFDPGATRILGVAQAGDDPRHRAMLKSSMNLGSRFTLDAALRYVSALPEPFVPAYTELNGRLAWHVSDRVELGLSGWNLLHDRHVEFPQGNAIPRSFLVDLRLRF